jgi:phosphatidylglycerophosphate synthase
MSLSKNKIIKYTDFISNYFYQQIAYSITKKLVYSSITPNMITIVSLILGIFSGIVLYFNLKFLAILLLNISFILDCVDGQLARAKKLQSDFGMWLDNISDRIVENSIILSVLISHLSNNSIVISAALLLVLNMQYSYMSDMIIYRNNSTYKSLSRMEKLFFSPIYFISRSMIIPMLSLLICFPLHFSLLINILYAYGILFRIYRELYGKV